MKLERSSGGAPGTIVILFTILHYFIKKILISVSAAAPTAVYLISPVATLPGLAGGSGRYFLPAKSLTVAVG
jgi:hypothetical protein